MASLEERLAILEQGLGTRVRLDAKYQELLQSKIGDKNKTEQEEGKKTMKITLFSLDTDDPGIMLGHITLNAPQRSKTIAIAANKPLFSVNVSDVGTKAQFVEKNLDKTFDLAATWEAILLIDEADVFLESRSKGSGFNTERNALVSIFLRVLEYYQGILFLTTNQIAQFDAAVQSRIRIALKYNVLNEEQTKAIFDQFIDQLDKNKQVKDPDDIKTWVRNGIADVVDIARDFKTEFQIQFDRYLTSQKGLGQTSE
ncbi:hypothetical protein BDV96DRAFT_644883 [Lophiotrema nucula]|uniref:ATPase AAA-type core domain-containing protein n=1 Tax=Lophiotrema nucula TaxID=690887 RepID=A0A6A5ZGG6_9PLEO|nr:hypothetical protein BDV96DRAFT_644883 [Lophiotrema nucula]